MKRLALLLCTLPFAVASALAQDVVVAPRPPQVWIDPGAGASQPLSLAEVAIDIRIHGFVASTRLDLSFANPNARVLEGELVFPLAEGQRITGYALEVDGALREGVVVPKETARVAFEEVTRRRVDPGLAELTRGNVFRTRLYPIPANGRKRVVIEFEQPLRDVGTALRYVLPLQFTQPVALFRVHAEAVRSEKAPLAVPGKGSLGFSRWRDSFVADLERRDIQPERELAFDLPKSTAAPSVFAVPELLDPQWRTFIAQVDSGRPAQLPALAPARRVRVLYDASGSARQRDRVRELDVLTRWLARLREVTVELVAFRNEVDAPRSFAIRAGDTSALRAAIEALPLDGASNYGALRDATSSADAIVLIGDGLDNFGSGEARFAARDGSVPRVIVLHAAQAADSPHLARIASQHAGIAINLLEVDADEALRRIEAPRWLLSGIRVLAGECEQLTPSAPQAVGSAVDIAGRCRGDARLALDFSGGGRKVERSVVVDARSLLDPARGAFVQRLWATARIAQIEAQATPDAAAVLALATRYSVVTAQTSLLVLDRIEDYVHYQVSPREPELAAQYRALLAAQPKPVDDSAQRAAHFDRVAAEWKALLDWHRTRHAGMESLLLPTAQLELARWQSLAPGEGDAKAAQDLSRRAQDLQQRWPSDGAQASSRSAWEAEATRVMLAIDGLRQRRLTQWPQSDSITAAPMEQRAARREAVADMRANSASEMAPPASPPPPPASEEPAPAPILESIVVAGQRERDAPVGSALAAKDAGADAGSTAAPPLQSAGIVLADWDPQTPWLKTLRAADDPYAAYLRERDSQALTPSFFLDCADFFRNEAKDPRLALRVLSNLAEIDLESAPLLRVLAYRLQQWDRFELAVPLFEVVLGLRGEEPQSRRDLALALSRQPQPDFERAMGLLWDVVARDWDGRFPEIQTIALHELDDVVARAATAQPGFDARTALDKLGVEARFRESLPVALRVVLSWDVDNTDVDLWVTDPTGDTAIYSQPRTRSGGHMSRDFTGGYGPEVFTIARAIPGTYVVKAHYFGDRVQKLTGAATLQAEFLTRFAAPGGRRVAVTRRLEGNQDVIEIGSFTVGAD